MTSRGLLVAALALTLAGCGTGGTTTSTASPAPGGASASPSPSPAATSAPTATASPAATPAATAAAGVLHVVTEEGPTCPVERVGAPPCVRPLSATVAVTPAGGGPGQEVVTGADGTADLRLAAGDYTVHPVSPGGGQSPPRPPPDQAATVGAGRTTTVTLVWDTGIR